MSRVSSSKETKYFDFVFHCFVIINQNIVFHKKHEITASFGQHFNTQNHKYRRTNNRYINELSCLDDTICFQLQPPSVSFCYVQV